MILLARVSCQGQADTLSESRDSARQREDVVYEVVDLSVQLARIGLVSQGLQLGSSLLADGGRSTRTVEGSSSRVVAVFEPCGLTFFSDPFSIS